MFNWGGKSVGALYDYIHMNMPPNEAGSLSDQRYADILAAIFQNQLDGRTQAFTAFFHAAPLPVGAGNLR